MVVHDVADLDFAIDFGPLHGVKTLRRVLLEMKACQEWSWPLFMSVDYDAHCGEIMAVFHKEGASEAQTILSYLPIFWKKALDPRCDNGFLPRAKLSSLHIDGMQFLRLWCFVICLNPSQNLVFLLGCCPS